MNATGKRLKLALSLMVVTVSLNAYVVVTGSATEFYGRLTGVPSEEASGCP